MLCTSSTEILMMRSPGSSKRISLVWLSTNARLGFDILFSSFFKGEEVVDKLRRLWQGLDWSAEPAQETSAPGSWAKQPRSENSGKANRECYENVRLHGIGVNTAGKLVEEVNLTLWNSIKRGPLFICLTFFFFIYQAVLSCGQKFIDEGHSSSDEIKARCDQLQENWDELNSLAKQRFWTTVVFFIVASCCQLFLSFNATGYPRFAMLIFIRSFKFFF